MPGTADLDMPPASPLAALTAKWAHRWEKSGVYHFDRSRSRAEVYSIDSPPPTVNGRPHIGHAFSYSHVDIYARYKRMRGHEVFFTLGWVDNSWQSEHRVQNLFGVRCDPSLPYDPAFVPPDPPRSAQVPVSRRNFAELWDQLSRTDEHAFRQTWRRLGISVDWRLSYRMSGPEVRLIAQRAFLRSLARGEAYLSDGPKLWDVSERVVLTAEEMDAHRTIVPRYEVAFGRPDADPVAVVIHRPELLAACVALVAHPDDERFAALFGTTAVTPVFGVAVPILASRHADPAAGTGLTAVLTFGGPADIPFCRELRLGLHAVLGADGRIRRTPPSGIDTATARAAFARIAGAPTDVARAEVVAMLRAEGALLATPGTESQEVQTCRRTGQRLEILVARQWFLRHGQDEDHRATLLERVRELACHPGTVGDRFRRAVTTAADDWWISRERLFGVPIPVWYPLDANGEALPDKPLLPDESALPVDPRIDNPPRYSADERDVPGGFTCGPDVMDAWTVAALTPQIASRWGVDDDLSGRVFPMDLRTQARDIVDNWLYLSVVRANAEHGCLPWSHVAVSGCVVDGSGTKVSKSNGNVEVGADELERYGPDAIRYWAAGYALGLDATVDTDRVAAGHRLAADLLAFGRLLPDPDPTGPVRVTDPRDRAAVDALAGAVREATASMDGYAHAAALAAVERAYWLFRRYTSEALRRAAGAEERPVRMSARTALDLGASVLLRLLAPFLPFATEEVWSWRRSGTVHRAPWPEPAELETPSADLTNRAAEEHHDGGR